MRRLASTLNDLVKIKMFNSKNQPDNSIKILSHNVTNVGIRNINLEVKYEDPTLIKPGYYL
jgi:hypothetical protein